MKKPKSWRKIHFGEEVWRYKIFQGLVEVRRPDNSKIIISSSDLQKADEFNARFRVSDEYCYDESISDDEYTLYYDTQEDCHVEFVSPKNKHIFNYYFGITPQKIKDYLTPLK